jgi:hypothetical protein
MLILEQQNYPPKEPNKTLLIKKNFINLSFAGPN